MDLRAELTLRASGPLARMTAPTLALILIAACTRPDAATSGGGPPPSIAYEGHVSAGGVAPPGAAMVNPFAGDHKSAGEGEKLFATMNCEGCHGIGATGSWAPNLVDGRWWYGATDGAIYHSIFYGRVRGMPAFGGILSETAIWKLVTYLKSQPTPKYVPTESWQ